MAMTAILKDGAGGQVATTTELCVVRDDKVAAGFLGPFIAAASLLCCTCRRLPVPHPPLPRLFSGYGMHAQATGSLVGM